MKMDWWLTGICASRVCYGLVFMTYAAALPVLRIQWEMSAAAAGSIATGNRIGYAVSLVVCSFLADRIGPKPLYLWSLSTAAFFSLGFAFFASSYLSGLLWYTFVGISLGGTYTTGLMIMSDHYPAQQRGKAIGYFIASTSFGYALSLAISGIALPLGGYRLSFLLTCQGTLLGAILAWITLAKTHVSVEKRKEGQRFSKNVLRNKPAMLVISGYSFHNWELLGMWAWTPAFLSTCLAIGGTSSLKAAGLGSYLTASFHLTGLVASFSMGALSDRLGRGRVMLMMSGVSALCSFVFGWAIEWTFAILITIGLIYAFSALGDSPVLSTALTEVVETTYLGAAFGLRSLLGFGAAAISPLVFGAVLDWTNPQVVGQALYPTWGWAYSVFGLGGLGAFLAAYWFYKTPRR
jgi:MFS family permease